jgi:hypothetical protein
MMKFSESGVKAETTGSFGVPGVYLLVLNDEVVYVGQGKDVWRRSLQSKREQRERCKDAAIYVIARPDLIGVKFHYLKGFLNGLESEMIYLFEPRYNGYINRSGRRVFSAPSTPIWRVPCFHPCRPREVTIDQVRGRYNLWKNRDDRQKGMYVSHSMDGNYHHHRIGFFEKDRFLIAHLLGEYCRDDQIIGMEFPDIVSVV